MLLYTADLMSQSFFVSVTSRASPGVMTKIVVHATETGLHEKSRGFAQTSAVVKVGSHFEEDVGEK